MVFGQDVPDAFIRRTGRIDHHMGGQTGPSNRDEALLEDWRRLTASDHFYYMCTKYWADGDVHKYFSPYDSPYDAYILEEDGSLASKIINEYRGLNLSRPPRITQAATASLAMEMLVRKTFHLVIAMPHLDDMDVFDLGQQIKDGFPDLPVVLLAHSVKGIHPPPEGKDLSGIDQIFIWSGVRPRWSFSGVVGVRPFRRSRPLTTRPIGANPRMSRDRWSLRFTKICVVRE